MSAEKRGEGFVMREGGPIDFSTFLIGFASTALIDLGAAPHPESGEVKVNLEGARQTLDVLAMLHDKTRGNLSAEEARLFESMLTDLRLRFVEASKK